MKLRAIPKEQVRLAAATKYTGVDVVALFIVVMDAFLQVFPFPEILLNSPPYVSMVWMFVKEGIACVEKAR